MSRRSHHRDALCAFFLFQRFRWQESSVKYHHRDDPVLAQEIHSLHAVLDMLIGVLLKAETRAAGKDGAMEPVTMQLLIPAHPNASQFTIFRPLTVSEHLTKASMSCPTRRTNPAHQPQRAAYAIPECAFAVHARAAPGAAPRCPLEHSNSCYSKNNAFLQRFALIRTQFLCKSH